MRFKFCGDMDCPDWVLSEIASLSKLSVVKVKLLTLMVAKHIFGQETLNPVQVQKHTSSEDRDTQKALVAALTFILEQSACYQTEGWRLSDELQQLGFPSEHAAQISKCYTDNQTRLQDEMRSRCLRLSGVRGRVWWAVDLVLDASEEEPQGALVHMKIPMWRLATTTTKTQANQHVLSMVMRPDQLRLWVRQLALILNKMETLQHSLSTGSSVQ